jgi:hypothetical protein
MAEESKTTSIIDDLPESQEADPTAKDLAFVTASWGRVAWKNGIGASVARTTTRV